MGHQANNCGFCGFEFDDSELSLCNFLTFTKNGTQTPLRSGPSWKLNICKACQSEDPFSDYLMAFELLKSAQAQPDAELTGPNIKIEPMESLIQEAVNRIKSKEPNYFAGVRSIVASNTSALGFVGGPNNDPNVIHINLPLIKSQVQRGMQGAGQKEIDEAVINEIISVISHEKGHLKGLDHGEHFLGESEAEQESNRVGKLF